MLQLIILYVLKRYGIDIEKLIRENPFILKNKKPESIDTEEKVDKILSDLPSGLLLKYQLGLENLTYVYIRKMLRTSIPYYEVVFDTHLNRSITQSMLRNMTFYKSFIHRTNQLERRIFTPPIALHLYKGKIPSNALVIKLDLAGRYYTQLTENNNYNNSNNDCNDGKFEVFYKNSGCERLNEISLSDFVSSGYSDHNELWLQKRKTDGNTKIIFSRVTYNVNKNALSVYLTVTPSYLNKPAPYKNGEIDKTVDVITKDGTIRKDKFYTCRFYFDNLKSFIKSSDEWMSLTKKDRIEIVRDLLKNYDNFKWFLNSMAFQYQGIWNKMDQLDSSIYPFPAGIPTRGTKSDFHWDQIHGDIAVVKHLRPCYEVALFNADKIAQAITDEFEKRKEI